MQFAHRVFALKFNEASYWPFLSREFAHGAFNLNLMGFAQEKGTKKTRRMTAIEAASRHCSVVGALESLACQIMVKFPPGSRIYKYAKHMLQCGAPAVVE